MSGIIQHWLPLLVTALLIFIVSCLISMALKSYNGECRKLVSEDNVRAPIRAGLPAPRQYVLPHCTEVKDMHGNAMQKKFVEAPNAFVTVRNMGSPTSGTPLSLWPRLSRSPV